MTVTQSLTRWFQPRTTDPNLIFRERTIRTLIVAILVIDILALLSSLLIFGGGWELISYPSAEVLVMVLLVLSAIAVSKGRITLSGYLLVGTFIIFSVFILTIPLSASNVAITASFMSLVVVAMVLPREAIFTTTGVLIGLLVIVALFNPQYETIRVEFITNYTIALIGIAILLYLLRNESDSRLLFLEASRRETEQALKVAQVARSEAERANKAKDQFLSIMSHELRTPLGAIIGFIGILQAGMIKDKKEALPLSQTQQKMLKDSRSNAEHLLTLINSILDLAKVSSGRIQPNFSTVNPQDENFITSTVMSLRSLALGKGIDLNLQMEADLPKEVQCDLMQIKQVVKNLVGNAIKFTEQGHVSVHLRRKSSDEWQINVQDTGIGIKPEQVGHIFDPFYQADNSDSRSREGTGLGLAIAKSYVDLHHGKIEVQSTIGTGTTFTITLPNSPSLTTAPVAVPAAVPVAAS
ncbi:MAG: HAMP domain-containing histidine kinase [Anaerolineae bacterium]|nr:HAMP domain-containing histidine kinase [Anaerolineae bacterium]